ncbi:MAG TPA: ABC transporter permease [Geminicoccaceae bacterium]|nr:ABC transporter permease [Geminicoccaceae bacterium]
MPFDLIARRILFAVPTLFGVAVIVFALGYLAPGDPALAALGLTSEGYTSFDAAEVERVRAELGLDQPGYVRFAEWLGGALVGDLGRSYVQPFAVSDLIGRALPVTLLLIAGTMTLAIVIGVPLGIVSAVWQGRWGDYLARVIAILGVSTPTFWLALILILVLAYTFPIFPISASLERDGPIALVLPILAIATHPAALIARMMRASMLEVLAQDYIRTATAKGLSAYRVVMTHALRNAINPVITVIGFQFGNLIGSAVAVEQIFALPGMGSLLIGAIYDKDVLVTQGVVLAIALVFILANLIVDLLYTLIDPRIRL